MALAFHRRSIDRDLDDLARSLGRRARARRAGRAAAAGRVRGTARCARRGGDAARAALAEELARPRGALGGTLRPAVAPLLRAHRIRRAGARHMSLPWHKYRVRHETTLQVRRRRDALASPAAPGAASRALPAVPGARDRRSIRQAIAAWIELDAFGNPLIRIELAQPHRELTRGLADADRGARAPAVIAGHHRRRGRRCATRSPIAAPGRRATSSTRRASATSRRTCG